MLLKNPRRKGGMLLKKSGRQGPYPLKTDKQAHNPPREGMEPIDFTKRFKGPRGMRALGKGIGGAMGIINIIGIIIDACKYAEEQEYCKQHPCECEDWANCIV